MLTRHRTNYVMPADAADRAKELLYQRAVIAIKGMDTISTNTIAKMFRTDHDNAKEVVARMEREGIVGPAQGLRRQRKLL